LFSAPPRSLAAWISGEWVENGRGRERQEKERRGAKG